MKGYTIDMNKEGFEMSPKEEKSMKRKWTLIKRCLRLIFDSETQSLVGYNRAITAKEAQLIDDFLCGKRFMSRYHAGQKKEKVVKEKKAKKSFVKAGSWII